MLPLTDTTGAGADTSGLPTGLPDEVTGPPLDVKKTVAEIRDDYDKWSRTRRPFEGSWFLAGAFLRGQQRVEYSDALARLVTPATPSHRIPVEINRIRPKIKARLAKFFKSRPKPVVIPASTERDDILNARGTEKLLSYEWAKHGLEEKYKDARMWATIASHGYIWLSWDESAEERVKMPASPENPSGKVTSLPVGDLAFEVSSPFEVLVADPTISRLGQQPAIIRAKMKPIADLKARYPELKVPQGAGDDPATNANGSTEAGNSTTRVPDRLASLNARSGDALTTAPNFNAHDGQVLVIEHFMAPCGAYPQGRYAVVVGEELAREPGPLPYDLWQHANNPYPVAEFLDNLTPGQYWGPTLIEQMISLQREYNFIRGLISENIRMMSRPKLLVYKQHNLPEGAYTTAAGEVIEVSWMPGLPPPQILQPSNVANDCWQLLQLLKAEFDDLTQIYPSSEGRAGDASSGYQSNILQEAADSVHAPDVREDELSIQDLAWKMRRLLKLGCDVPRLVTIGGQNSGPEMMEFSKDQIDEYAEVRIQAGSMLPELKSARMKTTMDMAQQGLFGDPKDPLVRRRILSMLDMGGFDVIQEEERRDDDLASQENQTTTQGGGVEPAQFFHDHIVHIFRHQNDLKTPEVLSLPMEIRLAKIAHTITHYDWINPQMGMSLRQQYNLNGLPIAAPPPPPPPMGLPPGPTGAPPLGPPAPPSPQGPR